jgi:hypothetical protein
MVSEKRLQHLDLEQGQIIYLAYIYVHVKLTKQLLLQTKNTLFYCNHGSPG